MLSESQHAKTNQNIKRVKLLFLKHMECHSHAAQAEVADRVQARKLLLCHSPAVVEMPLQLSNLRLILAVL